MHVVSRCFAFVRNFIIISRTVFNFQSGHEYRVELTVFDSQRAITPKGGKRELRFMCSARRLIEIFICLKFRENISDGTRAVDRIRMIEALTDGYSKIGRV